MHPLRTARQLFWSLGRATVTNGTVTLAHTTSARSLEVSNLVNGRFYTLIVKQGSTGRAAMTPKVMKPGIRNR
jgi:hypothetical protein